MEAIVEATDKIKEIIKIEFCFKTTFIFAIKNSSWGKLLEF